MRHWLVPKGWGRRLAFAYGYVGKYMASPEYKRLMNGESFDDIFNKDFLERKAAAEKERLLRLFPKREIDE
jgi:hypothetical protein